MLGIPGWIMGVVGWGIIIVAVATRMYAEKLLDRERYRAATDVPMAIIIVFSWLTFMVGQYLGQRFPTP